MPHRPALALLVVAFATFFGVVTAGANGETANEVLLQLQFAIGAHGAHPF